MKKNHLLWIFRKYEYQLKRAFVRFFMNRYSKIYFKNEKYFLNLV